MATGMQTTGRRTGTAMRPGAGGEKAGGLGGVMQKWNDMDPKTRTIMVVVVSLLVVSAIIFNVYTTSNKPVPLYSTEITTSDVQQMTTILSQSGIPFEAAEGGTNIMINPNYKSRALLMLASQGLPSRSIPGTTAGGSDSGIAPPTREEKERKFLLEETGDMVETIRQIQGVADAYIKIVPKPKDAWGGESKGTASASIMLKLVPGTQLSKTQIKGITHIVAYSVDGLEPENITIVDTTGKILNDLPGTGMELTGGQEGEYTTAQQLQKDGEEKKLRQKVQTALDRVLGPGRAEVQLSVEMDFSQREVKSIKHGGPGNVDGVVDAAVQKEEETYKSDPESSDGAQTMSTGGANSDNSDYKKSKIIVKKKVDQVEVRTVQTSPKIKKITCGVLVNGLKNEKMIANIESFIKNAIGYSAARGDSVSVTSVPFTMAAMASEMNNNAFANSGSKDAGWVGSSKSDKLPAWFYGTLVVPVVLVILMIGLFYMKQKNVQKEKQRLVLTAGPGATVSDISDLLSDKQGNTTVADVTKVNTNDQLEKLAKEKPTKVAELLKSTWLSE